MLRNYFKTALRNLVSNWTYSLTNIVGLSIGLAAGIFSAASRNPAHTLRYE